MNSPKVFLSYVAENRSIIESIDQKLSKYGIDVVVDYKCVKAGSNLTKVFRQFIEDSRYFIICCSKEFNQRERSEAYKELDYAIEWGKYFSDDRTWIIPVRINECKVPDREIRSGQKLNRLSYIDLFPTTQFEKGIKSIVESIKAEESIIKTNNKAEKHNRNRKFLKARKRLNRIMSFQIDMSPIEFITSLPKVKFDLLKEIERIKDSKIPKGGTTIDICEINDLYIDALQKILIKLASFYSQDYFIDESPQKFFSELIFARRPFYNIITEPEGTGTGGSIRAIYHTCLIIEDIENLIKMMVDGLLYPKGDYPGLDYDNWLRRWRDVD